MRSSEPDAAIADEMQGISVTTNPPPPPVSFFFFFWAFVCRRRRYRRRRYRRQVDDQVAAKNRARADLLKEYVSDSFSKGEVERVLDSIADANNYIAFNVAPVER